MLFIVIVADGHVVQPFQTSRDAQWAAGVKLDTGQRGGICKQVHSRLIQCHTQASLRNTSLAYQQSTVEIAKRVWPA